MSTQPDPQAAEAEVVTSNVAPNMQLEISNAVVRIYKHHLGKGPRSVRTHLNDDYALVILSGCLTQAERTLCEAGEHDLVMTQQHTLQRLMAAEMVGSVQSILGRSVASFMSTTDPEKELGVELFMLEPDRGAPETAAAS